MVQRTLTLHRGAPEALGGSPRVQPEPLCIVLEAAGLGFLRSPIPELLAGSKRRPPLRCDPGGRTRCAARG